MKQLGRVRFYILGNNSLDKRSTLWSPSLLIKRVAFNLSLGPKFETLGPVQ